MKLKNNDTMFEVFSLQQTHINFRRETSLGIWFFRILYLLQSRRSSPWLFLFKPFDVTKALPSTNNLHAAGAILQAVGDKVRVASKTSNWPNVFITKPTRCTNFTNLFWYETLHVSDSSSVPHQEFIHCTLRFRAGPG